MGKRNHFRHFKIWSMKRLICIRGKKVSNFLIQSENVAYPMEDTKYLETLPLWKDSYILLIQTKFRMYKLLKFLFINEKKNKRQIHL
jgi:hypothetical protein